MSQGYQYEASNQGSNDIDNLYTVNCRSSGIPLAGGSFQAKGPPPCQKNFDFPQIFFAHLLRYFMTKVEIFLRKKIIFKYFYDCFKNLSRNVNFLKETL